MNVPATMRAIEITTPGGPEVLRLVERPMPQPAAGEVLIRIAAAGLNRGDIAQRMGHYPPPPGVTDIPGLEAAGHIAAIGAGVTGWSVGDPVCALLAGGGYATYAAAPAVQCMPVPQGLTMAEAGGLPEAIFTCWMALVDEGHLKAGETVLIHGGASGIGTTAIPLAKALGAAVYTTAGAPEKCDACRRLGADRAINYKTEDFVEVIRKSGRSVDVVLDMVAGPYVARDMQIMAYRGRHINIAVLGGMESQVPMALLMMKQLTLRGTTLRGRPPAEKGAIAAQLRAIVWPMIAAGRIKPIVHARFPLAEAAAAQQALDGDHIGKIVLTME